MLASVPVPAIDNLWSIESAIALLALTLMEIVLGIDNIVFIAIKTSGLPEHQRPKARKLGLLAALVMRVLLLLCITWIAKLKDPILVLSESLPMVFGSLSENPEVNKVSVRDLLLLFGGMFLLWTGVKEIHEKIENVEEETTAAKAGFLNIIFTIAMMDIVFSFDSVLTAVGMAEHIEVMIAAVVISVAVMIFFANQISDFVEDNPTIKMLALSFLLLIGLVLVTEGAGHPLPKGYVYFAMLFSLGVEILNMRSRKSEPPAATPES